MNWTSYRKALALARRLRRVNRSAETLRRRLLVVHMVNATKSADNIGCWGREAAATKGLSSIRWMK